MIPQYKVTSTTRETNVQNSCQNSATSASTVVDPQTSATSSSQTTADKSPSSVDKSQPIFTPIPPIPPPPFQIDVGSSKLPIDVSSDDSHLQPSSLNAIIPYKGDLMYLKSHPPDQVIGNINKGVLTRTNPAELFDLDKFTFEDVSVKTNHAGTPQSSHQDNVFDIMIPQYKVTSTTRETNVQNSCQNSTTSTSTVVDPQTSATSSSQTTADKSPSSVDKSQPIFSPIPPIPPPPFQIDVGSSKLPIDVSSDDSHLQPSSLNAIIPYKGDLIYLKSHPPDQVIGNVNEGGYVSFYSTTLHSNSTNNFTLFDAIETQTQISPSHSPVKESTLPYVTEIEKNQSASPQTAEAATPHELHVTLGGSSSEAATTTDETPIFQLDSGYIYKSSLKATTVEGTIVNSVPIGSP
ncbi:transcription factor SFL2-like [Helianthus annuus]|uniref:transcription factor SFL2-like n=1 Tax=Helianthus annuus TaxID=4232 RepID=UPI000B8F5F84|nr:transcription factor SFL2-like [Helianthus annuus]